MCFCIAFFFVIVSVVETNDREAQLGLSASASNINRVTQCRCPQPPLGTSVENIRLEHGFLYSF